MIKWICQLNNGDSDGTITFYDSSDTTASAKNKLLSGVIKKEVNSAGSFVFEIHKTNSNYSKFKILNTKILCYGVDTSHSNRIIGNFLGRVSNIEFGFDGVVKITCEDAYATLRDAKDWMRAQKILLEPENNQTLIDALFKYGVVQYSGLLYNYNLLGGQHFEFYNSDSAFPYSVSGWEELDLDSQSLHILAASDYDVDFDRGWDDEATVLDSLEDYINTHGGYVVIEPISKDSITSTVKLMWFPEYKSPPTALKESQTLDFGTNILKVSKSVDAEEIFTRLYPYGKEDYWTLNGESGSQYYEAISGDDLTDLNAFDAYPLPLLQNGDSTQCYVDVSDDAISTYGIIEKSVIFDTAKTQEKLLKKAQNYIKKNFRETYTIDVTALDLATIGKDKVAWHIGRYVKIDSSYHNISGWFLITAIEQNLFNPSKSKITFNNKPTKITKKNKSTAQSIKKAVKETKVNTASTTTNLYLSKVSSTDARKIKFVSELPETPDETVIYLIPEE